MLGNDEKCIIYIFSTPFDDYVIAFMPEEILTNFFLMKYPKKQSLNLVGSNFQR